MRRGSPISTPQGRPVPAELAPIEALLKARMPGRHLLDVLRNVHYWAGYTRHLGPPSGADPKLTDAVVRYIFTVFGYAHEQGRPKRPGMPQDRLTGSSCGA